VKAKALVQSLAGCVTACPVFWPLVRRLSLGRVNVIYYHYVGASCSYYKEFYKGCTVERLRRDLAALSKVYEFVPLQRAVELNGGAEAPAAPCLAVTFDDGFDLNKKELQQLFDEFGVKVTTFVITSCLDNKNLMWRNKLSVIRATVEEEKYVPKYNALAAKVGRRQISRGSEMMAAASEWDMALKDELADQLWKDCGLPPLRDYLDEHQPYFTWDGLRSWIKRGHSVGFHTRTHPRCSQVKPGDLNDEIIVPAKELKEKLGLDWLPFSYPFGDRFPRQTEEELFKNGVFDSAFGIEGFAERHTPNHRLERQEMELAGAGWSVFGKAMLGLGPRSTVMA